MNLLGETIIGEAVSDVLGYIKEKIDSQKEENDLIKLFSESADFLVKHENDKSAFYDDLMRVFSEENIKEIALKAKEKSGFEFKDELSEQLRTLLMSYELDTDNVERCINHFLELIIEGIRKDVPDLYDKMLLKDWGDDVKNKLDIIEHRLDALKEIENAIGPLRRKKIYTIAEMNQQLNDMTEQIRLNIGFFEIEDQQFQTEFKRSLATKSLINIVGKSREEVLYSILNELNKMNLNKPVFIVKCEEDWEDLRCDELNNAILIPYFYAANIQGIKNNINIFIYGEDEWCSNRDKLELRRKTRRNLISSLEKSGMNATEAYDLVRKTNGLYVLIKRQIFFGGDYEGPKWAKEQNEAFITALLIGKWTESEGDKAVIEEVSGMKYEEFKKKLKPYMNGGDPFIVEVHTHSEIRYQLANVEEAWGILEHDIDQAIWERFKEKIIGIITELDPLFNLSFEQHFAGRVFGKNPKYTNSLKEGIIRTLTMRVCLQNSSGYEREVNSIVGEILKWPKEVKEWAYLSQFLPDLCEASPSEVMKCLEEQLNSDSSLIHLFSVDDGDGVTMRNYYTNVIWAAEQLLLQKKYVKRAVNWLWKMDKKNIKYRVSNSPKDTLENIFCIWCATTILTTDQKIAVAAESVNEYENAWFLIFNKVLTGNNGICSSINKPKYRMVEEIEQPLNKDIEKIHCKYIEICLGRMNRNVDKWKEVLEKLDAFNVSHFQGVIERLENDIEGMEEAKKQKIKEIVRSEIYRHRFYANAWWALPEEFIQKLEKVYNGIHLQSKAHEYAYLFKCRYQIPVLHPVTYEEGIDYQAREKEIVEKEVKYAIEDIQTNTEDFLELMEIVSESYECTLGMYLAKYYSNYELDKELYKSMLSISKGNVLSVEYIQEIYYKKGQNVLKEAIVLVNEADIKDKEKRLVELYRIEPLGALFEPLIMNANEEMKELYWKQPIWHFDCKEKDRTKIILDYCKKYSAYSSFVTVLYDCRKQFSAEEIKEYLMWFTDEYKKGKCRERVERYMLEDLICGIQSAFIKDEKECCEISSIEIFFREAIGWEKMKCTKWIMQKTPNLYAEIVGCIFKKDSDMDKVEKKDHDVFIAYYDFYQNFLFCPCEEGGTVKYKELKEWVNSYRQLLDKQEQGYLFGRTLGRLFAHAPIGKDNYYPCEAVRMVIEELKDEKLSQSYITEEFYKRGIYEGTSGKAEYELSLKHKESAKYLEFDYPITAEIFERLSKMYQDESDWERRCAEDDW